MRVPLVMSDLDLVRSRATRRLWEAGLFSPEISRDDGDGDDDGGEEPVDPPGDDIADARLVAPCALPWWWLGIGTPSSSSSSSSSSTPSSSSQAKRGMEGDTSAPDVERRLGLAAWWLLR